MTRVDIEEFRIKIEDDQKVRVEWCGQGDRGDLELDNLRLRTLNVLIGLLRSNRLRQVDELKILGEHLFVTLFGRTPEGRVMADDGYGGPGALLRKAIKGERAPEDASRRLLKVTLEIRAGNDMFASWPWEYLYVPENPLDPNTGFFLGERTNFVLTRNLPLVDSARAIRVRPPLRILFVVLSPANLPTIEYEAVLETLLRLRDEEGESRIGLWVLTEDHAPDGSRHPDASDQSRTTYRSFLGSVDQFDPHVIHIISHGRYGRTEEEGAASGQLAFTKDDSTAGWISDRDIANQLMDSPSLRLVFLQACETAETSSNPYQVISGMAQWLAQKNIPAVIAMHFQIKSSLANEFARAFYEALVERAAIEVAMHAARRQLYTSGVVGDSQRTGFGLPVLYLRGSGALLTPLESPAASPSSAGEPRASAESRMSGLGPLQS
jgi:hypothetical protein